MSPTAEQNALLISSDQQTVRRVLAALAARGVRGTAAADTKKAANRLRDGGWDILIFDADCCSGAIGAPVALARKTHPDCPVVTISGRADVEAALSAVRGGCDDYLVKPLETDLLEAMLRRLLPGHEVPLVAEGGSGEWSYRIAGVSPSLRETVRLARKVAGTSIPVLISGESGTGKELIACLIHDASRRRGGPFVRVNCAALSESLLESELFGHERGAFTGAHARRRGRFERAHCGTLLLDEISETTPRLQAELLRVLEHQRFERVGGSEPIHADVRIISTSNRDLIAEVERGAFRADLFYRLAGMHLTVPPLRQRSEDIPALAWHFVNMYAGESGRRISELDAEMLDAMRPGQWPGNVRELRNAVRTALVLGEGPTLRLPPCRLAEAQAPQIRDGLLSSLRLGEIERRAILEALRRTKSHQAKAARLLGITDRTLREKLRRYRREGRLADNRDEAPAGGVERNMGVI